MALLYRNFISGILIFIARTAELPVSLRGTGPAPFEALKLQVLGKQKLKFVVGVTVIRDIGESAIKFVGTRKNNILDVLGKEFAEKDRVERRSVGHAIPQGPVIPDLARDGEFRRFVIVKVHVERVD